MTNSPRLTLQQLGAHLHELARDGGHPDQTHCANASGVGCPPGGAQTPRIAPRASDGTALAQRERPQQEGAVHESLSVQLLERPNVLFVTACADWTLSQ